jgi:hypothetical protein
MWLTRAGIDVCCFAQGVVEKSVQWNDSIDYLSTEHAYSFVRSTLCLCPLLFGAENPDPPLNPRRALADNQFVGTIPSRIIQLTILNKLYVDDLVSASRLHD